MIIVFTGWIEKEILLLKGWNLVIFSDIPSEILADISNYAQKIKASIPWKAGDFALIDN